MQPNIAQITKLAEEVASSLGLDLLDIKLGAQGKNRALIVTIYKRGSAISLQDCEQLSRKLEQSLDGAAPALIDGAYVLEVESPGTDRKLGSPKEFDIFRGSHVEVKTKQKVDGLGSAFTGKLAGFTGDRVVIAQPQKMSDKPAHKKKADAKNAPALASVEVDMQNVIHVKLSALAKDHLPEASETCTAI
jgi:ribosome maturation factor RimP